MAILTAHYQLVLKCLYLMITASILLLSMLDMVESNNNRNASAWKIYAGKEVKEFLGAPKPKTSSVCESVCTLKCSKNSACTSHSFDEQEGICKIFETEFITLVENPHSRSHLLGMILNAFL